MEEALEAAEAKTGRGIHCLRQFCIQKGVPPRYRLAVWCALLGLIVVNIFFFCLFEIVGCLLMFSIGIDLEKEMEFYEENEEVGLREKGKEKESESEGENDESEKARKERQKEEQEAKEKMMDQIDNESVNFFIFSKSHKFHHHLRSLSSRVLHLFDLPYEVLPFPLPPSFLPSHLSLVF